MNLLLRTISFCALGIAAQAAVADSGWVLTTADLRQQPVALESIGDAGVVVLPLGAAQAMNIGYDDFLQIDRSSQPRSPAANLTIILTNGDRLSGQPQSTKDEQVSWRSPAVGEVVIPLKQVRAMIRSGSSIENLDQPPTEDRIVLNNGDSAKGIITDVSASKVTLQAATALEIPLDSIRSIHFALAAAPATETARGFRVRLNDDSLIRVASVQGDQQKLALVLSQGGKREIPLANVVGIEQLNGPVSWLSSRTPSSIVQRPFFGGMSWPTRMDSSVGGKPIQFGDRIYARGIGVHAYSRIDYPLDGSYEAFRTQYAIAQDEKRQYADVTVRIKLDGRTVHERQSLKADQLPPPVVIDLPKSARLLTLEVDYGLANDTQDRLNWIEPALLRKRPPQTQPATPGAAATQPQPGK